MVATEKTFWDKRYGRNFLKITALLTMLIDHIGCVFLMERGDIIYKAFRVIAGYQMNENYDIDTEEDFIRASESIKRGL